MRTDKKEVPNKETHREFRDVWISMIGMTWCKIKKKCLSTAINLITISQNKSNGIEIKGYCDRILSVFTVCC